MINPRIKHRFSEVRTREDATQVWCERRNDLVGYTFVLSDPQEGGNLQLPARLDFPDGGYLRSVFAHDNLFVVNHEVMDRTLTHGRADIPVDYTVSFDANVATYLRAWHQGHSTPVVGMLQSAFHALRGGRFNWDSMPFLLERAQDILDGRDLDKIYETELASCWFDASDRADLAQTGQIR